MSRLTEKVNYRSSWVEETIETDEYIPLNYSTDTTIGKCVDKLGKLEDLEEQLGCSLDILFKALSDGIWSVRYNTYKHSKIHRLTFINGNYYLVVDDSYYNIKDYKKTWWLREDKSE